jgi:hypothetical protein
MRRGKRGGEGRRVRMQIVELREFRDQVFEVTGRKGP